MRLLLDTNICIAFLNGADAAVRDQLLSRTPRDLAVCSVVKAELLYGARKSQRVGQNLERLARFFEAFESLPFDDIATNWYGTIRAQLESTGRPIGANDLMIAATTLAADATLVTRDAVEFRRIVGLRVIVW